mmetsp:Transcript_8645/g.13591  ORF Transcript_8645/g.13591 Transcript_8645/m.13591 type:complete len:364 (-) Transcript_8645:296-1387(-)
MYSRTSNDMRILCTGIPCAKLVVFIFLSMCLWKPSICFRTPLTSTFRTTMTRSLVRKNAVSFLSNPKKSRLLMSSNRDDDSFSVPQIPGELGVLPFPIQDLMTLGESKTLHLYESRFLELFQDAMIDREELAVQAIIVEQPSGIGFLSVASLLKIEEWDKLAVGVTATVKCTGRVRLRGVTQAEPYLSADVAYLTDDAPGESQGDAIRALTEEVVGLHASCRGLHLRLAADEYPEMPDLAAAATAAGAAAGVGEAGPGDDARLLWGHEAARPRTARDLYALPLPDQVAATAAALGGAAAAGVLGQPEAPELVSLQAAGFLPLEKRLAAFETTNTLKRMRILVDYFTEEQKLLAAKVALKDLNL